MDESFALSTLADADLLSQAGGTTVVDSVIVSSIKVAIAIAELNDTDGPIVLGVAHSDYTDPEIEEWIEATASWDFGDKIAEERAKRRCRMLAIIDSGGLTVSGAVSAFNGAMRKFKLNFRLMEGDSLNFWAYNRSGKVLTTGSIVKITGVANCRII